MSDFEAFAGNVNLKVRIITTVENSVIGTATVKLDDKLERIEFFGQLLLLVSEAESFCPDSANFLILPKIVGLMTIMPILVTLSVAAGIIGAYATSLLGTTTVPELTEGFRYQFNQWFFWCGMIKAVVYAFIITSVSAYKGYTVEGGSVEVGKSSTDAVVTSSILVLFSDIFLTNMLT